MIDRRVVVTLLGLCGCYAEIGAGYYPSIHESMTTSPGMTSETKTSGYVAMAKLGFYLDVPVPALKMSFGAGMSPGVGGEGINPSGSQKVGTQGYDVRVDVALPYFLSVFQPRVTVAYFDAVNAGVNSGANTPTATVTGSGHTLFLGASLGGTTSGSLVLASIGLQYQKDTTETTPTVMPFDISGYGVAARLMVTWTPTGAFLQSYTPSKVEAQKFTPCTVHTITTCDPNHKNCTTESNCY